MSDAKEKPVPVVSDDDARVTGCGDARNTREFRYATVARFQWLRATRAEAERRRRESLEARPDRLAKLAGAARKRARRAALRREMLSVWLSA